MHTSHLDERQKDVLKSVIQIHIATGEPVGSESLARHLNRSMSSATLRNVMADLEKLGYLDHPHTSAGRMPTDEGYRVYVDSLMSHERRWPARDAAAIESELRPGTGRPARSWRTPRVLSRRPQPQRRLRAGPGHRRTALPAHRPRAAAPPRILVVMVSRTGLVTHRVIEVEDDLTQDELQACANYLNAHFSGLTLDAIRARLLELMREEKALYDSLLKKVVSVGSGPSPAGGRGQRLPGRRLEHPRPAGVRGPEPHAGALQDVRGEGPAGQILNACLSDGLRVFIGHEKPDPELQSVALVTASYPVAARRAGAWACWGRRAWSTDGSCPSSTTWPRSVALTDIEMPAEEATETTTHGPGRKRPRRAAWTAATRRASARRTRSRRCAASATSCATSSCASAPSSRTTASGSSATASRPGRRRRPRC